MKRKIIALILLVPAAAYADLSNLPPWHMTNGEACYGFDDAKKLLDADNQLALCGAYKTTVPQLQTVITQLQAVVAKKDEALKLSLDQASTLKTNMDTCIDQRATAQSQAASGPSIGWLVAGGIAAIFLGYIAATKF